MVEPLLKLDKVTAGYGDAVVLHDISLELPEHGSPGRVSSSGARVTMQEIPERYENS